METFFNNREFTYHLKVFIPWEYKFCLFKNYHYKLEMERQYKGVFFCMGIAR